MLGLLRQFAKPFVTYSSGFYPYIRNITTAVTREQLEEAAAKKMTSTIVPGVKYTPCHPVSKKVGTITIEELHEVDLPSPPNYFLKLQAITEAYCGETTFRNAGRTEVELDPTTYHRGEYVFLDDDGWLGPHS